MVGITPLRSRPIAAALLAAAAACGAPAAGAPGTAPEPAPVPAARIESARRPLNEADVRFMTGMIGHHAQAIEMGRLAPSRAGSASLRTLAARIINSQQDEIATMQQWLRDRGQPVPETHSAGMQMMHAGEHAMMMPGTLTEAQMEQLAGATGEEFDQLFLRFMIQHHRGAVLMVRDLFGSYGAGQDESVFKIASDVNVDQTTEIARMQRMLRERIFEDLSP